LLLVASLFGGRIADMDDESAEVGPHPAEVAPATTEADPVSPAHRPKFSVRRFAVVIALALIVIVGGFGTALVLMQRVHTDPWRLGATSVGLISVDPSRKVPSVFAGASLHPQALAYQNFHGLGAVVSEETVNGSRNSCMVIYSDADLAGSVLTDPSGNSFNGLYFRACAAGTFPAVVQFDLSRTDLPPELRSAFPKRTALQFVYDGRNHEIAIFAE
jgi:hypothetical protein